MKQARATSGSFYHFFPTKDDLLLAVLDAVGELIATDVLAVAEAGSDDLFDRVSIVIDAYRARTGPSAPGYGTPVGTLVGELGPDHAAALRRVEKIYTLMVSRIAGWFANSGNRWRSSSDPMRLAEFIVGALEGASMMAIAARSNAPIDACAEQMRLHLDSLALGRNLSAEEMPPPDSSAAEAVDWKSW